MVLAVGDIVAGVVVERGKVVLAVSDIAVGVVVESGRTWQSGVGHPSSIITVNSSTNWSYSAHFLS